MSEVLKKRKEISKEDIAKFLEGRDPQKRIVNLEYNYQDDFIKVYYRNEEDKRCMSVQPFLPFLWAKLDACMKLLQPFGGSRDRLNAYMKKSGIWVKKLSVTNNEGVECPEMLNGYRFLFYATKPMSYSEFLNFFKKLGCPVYSNNKGATAKKDSKLYLTAPPQEQYLISTGKRFFKGYEDYNELLRMIFDLETEGLNPVKDRIKLNGIRFNRKFKTADGREVDRFEGIFRITGKTKEERDKSELKVIDDMLRIIYAFQPDVITAHNGENFDWNFIIERCKQLGTTIEAMSKPYFKGDVIFKDKKESILKLGGEIEKFHRTVVPATIITDSLHAVRRAQALDSNMQKADLKYVTEYSDMKKPNRVYTVGEKIDDILIDLEEHYAFNDEDGDWYIYDPSADDDPVVKPDPKMTEEYFEELYKLENEDSLRYYYGDNFEAKQDYREFISEFIYDEMRDELMEKLMDEDLSDEEFDSAMDAFEEGWDNSHIPEDKIKEWEAEYPYDEYVKDSIQRRGGNPKNGKERYADYLASIDEANKFKKGKVGNKPFVIHTRNYIADGYTLVSGEYIIERYLLDDLYECDVVEHRYNMSNFLICKMLPVPFSKCCTMGTAGQWKALLMAWSYEQGLAIPPFGESKSFTGGLSRLLSVGFVANVAKFDYNSLYPSIILTWGISDPKDLMQTMLAFLEHVLTQREKYKILKKKAGKEKGRIEKELKVFEGTDEKRKELERLLWQAQFDESANDKKQLPLKILGNSFFGSYGAPNVFPWASIECAERTTCTGRQSLRLMIKKFNDLGYKPIVGDTDGFNFQLPEARRFRFTDKRPYISSGLSRETKKDEAYSGFKADVAEFNDLYMRDFHYGPNCVNKMGLGIDEVVDATINFSRKNYADYFPKEPFPKDVKLVGNTVKSKKMPEYIAKFLEKGVRLLLQGNGLGFLNAYYDYVEKIYNYQIPLKDIANKGKVKKTLDEYIEDCQTTTAAGSKKSRQAWMELALRDGVNVNLGDTIYYVNTGQKKGDKDCQRITKFYGHNTNSLFDGEDDMVDMTKIYKKEYDKSEKGYLLPKDKRPSFTEYMRQYHPDIKEVDEVKLCCEMLPPEIANSDLDYFCADGTKFEEYNAAKYIDQFNSRITPLLVCFSKDIRNKILITNPDDRQSFTEKEAQLCSGQPNKESDQDTYEQLMTMDDREIRFWMRHPEWKIPFLEECGQDWEKIKADYLERKEKEKQLGVDKTREAYENALENLTLEDFDDIDDGKLPKSISLIVQLDPKTNNFVSKEYTDIVIGSIYDLFDAREFLANKVEEEFSLIVEANETNA